jgi:hypothetical protein
LTKAFTHEDDSLHPQWIIVDLGKYYDVNARFRRTQKGSGTLKQFFWPNIIQIAGLVGMREERDHARTLEGLDVLFLDARACGRAFRDGRAVVRDRGCHRGHGKTSGPHLYGSVSGCRFRRTCTPKSNGKLRVARRSAFLGKKKRRAERAAWTAGTPLRFIAKGIVVCALKPG